MSIDTKIDKPTTPTDTTVTTTANTNTSSVNEIAPENTETFKQYLNATKETFKRNLDNELQTGLLQDLLEHIRIFILNILIIPFDILNFTVLNLVIEPENVKSFLKLSLRVSLGLSVISAINIIVLKDYTDIFNLLGYSLSPIGIYLLLRYNNFLELQDTTLDTEDDDEFID